MNHPISDIFLAKYIDEKNNENANDLIDWCLYSTLAQGEIELMAMVAGILVGNKKHAKNLDAIIKGSEGLIFRRLNINLSPQN